MAAKKKTIRRRESAPTTSRGGRLKRKPRTKTKMATCQFCGKRFTDKELMGHKGKCPKNLNSPNFKSKEDLNLFTGPRRKKKDKDPFAPWWKS